MKISFSIYSMWDTLSVSGEMTLRDFARSENRGAPLNEMLHARFPKSLAVFLKTAALTEDVSESTLIQYACEQWATSQGYSRLGF